MRKYEVTIYRGSGDVESYTFKNKQEADLYALSAKAGETVRRHQQTQLSDGRVTEPCLTDEYVAG